MAIELVKMDPIVLARLELVNRPMFSFLGVLVFEARDSKSMKQQAAKAYFRNLQPIDFR